MNRFLSTLSSYRSAPYLFVIILISLIFVSQVSYDSNRYGMQVRTFRQPFVLSAEVLKKTSLGFNNFLADLLWIQTIQYYGGSTPSEGYIALPQYLDSITQLDPHFAYPYIFSSLILPDEDATEKAKEIGKRGTETIKNNWEIPYYLAFVYHKEQNYEEAAKYFQEAANRPDALPITKVIAGIYYAKAGQREVAMAIWQGIYESTDNEFVKERSQKWLEHYQMIILLEELAQKYKEQYHRFPNSLDDFVKAKILPEVPVDPLGRTLTINPETGKIAD